MNPASGHNSKFARNEFEAEAGGLPDSFQAPPESKEVYQKNGITQEITYGSPESDTEGPFAHHCAMNAVIWKFYMEQARIFNEHLANSLNGDLDPLLIFAGLFSAILTAFLIEIRKGLQEDLQDRTNDLLIILIQNQHNVTDLPTFTPTLASRWVNGLWFSSLVLSLMSALGASLAKGWGTQFSATVLGSSWNDAKLHCSRLRGLKRWHLHLIVQCLPILIHIAFFLFSVGLVILLFGDDRTMGIAICALTVPIVVLYIGSSIHPTLYADSPFRTPVSGMIQGVLRLLRGASRLQSVQEFPEETYAQKAQALAWLLFESQNSKTLNAAVYAIAGLVANPRTQDQLLCRPTVDILSQIISTELIRRPDDTDLLKACLYALLRLVQHAPMDGEDSYMTDALRALVTSGALSAIDPIPENLRSIALCVRYRIILLLEPDRRLVPVWEADIPGLIKECGDQYLRRLLSEISVLKRGGSGKTDEHPFPSQWAHRLRNPKDRQRDDINTVHTDFTQEANTEAYLIGGIVEDYVLTVLDGLTLGSNEARLKYAGLLEEMTLKPTFRQKLAITTSGETLSSITFRRVAGILGDSDQCIRQAAWRTLSALVKHKDILASISTTTVRETVIQMLTDLNADTRRLALEALTALLKHDDNRLYIATPAIWEMVVGMLEDPDQDVHSAAQQTLIAFMKYDDMRASLSMAVCQKFPGMLGHSSQVTRHAAMQILITLLDHEGNRLLVATPAMWGGVVRMLTDSDRDARDMGLQMLGEFMKYDNTRASISTVMCQKLPGMLEDSSQVNRRAALQILMALLDHADTRSSIASSATWHTVVGMLEYWDRNVCDAALQMLREFMKYDDMRASISVVVCERLAEMLKNNNQVIRSAPLQILMALLDHGDIRSWITTSAMWERVVEMVEDPDRDVRDAALQLLHEFMKYEEIRVSISTCVCQTLSGMLQHSEWGIRHLALETLKEFLEHDATRASITTPAVWESVVQMLEYCDQGDGVAALQILCALIKYDDTRDSISTEMRQRLAGMLEHSSWVTRHAALQILMELLDHNDTQSSITTSVIWERVVVMLEDSVQDVHNAAQQTLMAFMRYDHVRVPISTGVCGRLAGMLEHSSRFTRRAALQIIMALLDHDDTRSSIMISAIRERVIGILEDSVQDVRNAAQQTLIAFMKYDDTRASISTTMCQRLTGMLEHSSRFTRRAAVQTLMALLDYGDTRSSITTSVMWGRVVEMVDDPDRDVRDAALQMLRELMKHVDTGASNSTALWQRLTGMLQHTSQVTRCVALELLMALLDHDDTRASIATLAMQEILDMLRYWDQNVRDAALRMLREFMRYDDTRYLISPDMCQRLPKMLEHSSWVIRRAALQILMALLDHDDTRSLIATCAMWEGILGMLEDCNRNVRDTAHQTLIVFMKYDDVRTSIPTTVYQRLRKVLQHSEGDIRHIALEALTAFFDHDNTRSLFADLPMWERVVEMLKDSDRDVGDGAQQTLTAFTKHDDTRTLISSSMCQRLAMMLEDGDDTVSNAVLKTLIAFMKFDDTRPSISTVVSDRLAEMLKHPRRIIRRAALRILLALLGHEDNLLFVVTPALWERVTGTLEDSDQDVHDVALETLLAFVKYGDFRKYLVQKPCREVFWEPCLKLLQRSQTTAKAISILKAFAEHDDTRSWILDARTGIILELQAIITQGRKDFDRWSQGLKGWLALGLS